MNTLMLKIALGFALAGALTAGSATASLAFGGERHYYEPSANGSVWSFYPGYYDGQGGGRISTSEAPNAYGWSAPDRPRTRPRHPVRQRQGRDDDSQ